ncbi:MAG: hypothetical protein AAGA91_13465 [Pseudomonadota bacterium]
MGNRMVFTLRYIAATLVVASGVAMLASLWSGELIPYTVLTAIVGGIYIILGIGLYGQSRFSLFVGAVMPLTLAWYQINQGIADAAGELQFAVNLCIAALSLTVLWQVRKRPST